VKHHNAQNGRAMGLASRPLFILYLLLIAWLPLPLGSNRVWAWSFFELAAFLLAGAWFVHMLLRQLPLPEVLIRLKVPLLLLGAWMLYQWLQLVPLPLALLEFLSPSTAAMVASGEPVIGTGFHALSLDRGSSLAGVLKNTAYLLMLLMTLLLVNSRKRLRALMILLLCVGLGEALLAIAGYYGNGLTALWVDAGGTSRAHGTYPNPNHFGALVSISISVTLGLLLASMTLNREGKGMRGILTRWISLALSPRAVLIVALVTMFGALYLSNSRGASLSLFFSLLLVISFGIFRHGWQSREAAMLPVALLLSLGAAVFMGAGRLMERFLRFQAESEERLVIWQTALEMVSDYPFFGIGEGGFQWLFPAYESIESSSAWFKYAHNDYLELLVNQGILGAFLLGSAMLLLLRHLFRSFTVRRDPLVRGVLFATLSAMLAFLIHALFDFNFHIPANAAWFHVMLGAGLVACQLPSRHAHSHVV
jgi:putative inorganic carbon (HCO3(-)) transporter